jgi:hypothetical protein
MVVQVQVSILSFLATSLFIVHGRRELELEAECQRDGMRLRDRLSWRLPRGEVLRRHVNRQKIVDWQLIFGNIVPLVVAKGKGAKLW